MLVCRPYKPILALLALALLMGFVLRTPVSAAAHRLESLPLVVHGRPLREAAIDDGGHLLVPVRGVFAAFGASVTYTAPRFVVVRKDGLVIAGLIVNSRHAVVGDRPRTLAVAPLRRRGRVYVPLRAIAEIAGAGVKYVSQPRSVEIRVPFDDIALHAKPVVLRALPAPAAAPRWAYAAVGLLAATFLFELARRIFGSPAAARTPSR